MRLMHRTDVDDLETKLQLMQEQHQAAYHLQAEQMKRKVSAVTGMLL